MWCGSGNVVVRLRLPTRVDKYACVCTPACKDWDMNDNTIEPRAWLTVDQAFAACQQAGLFRTKKGDT